MDVSFFGCRHMSTCEITSEKDTPEVKSFLLWDGERHMWKVREKLDFLVVMICEISGKKDAMSCIFFINVNEIFCLLAELHKFDKILIAIFCKPKRSKISVLRASE